MNYSELVEKVQKYYDGATASINENHVAIEFQVEGEAEGVFYVEITDGNVNVAPFDYKDRDVRIATTAEVLTKIADGKLTVEEAYNSGEFQAVAGEAAKVLALNAAVVKKAAKKATKTTATKKTETKAAKKTTTKKAEPKTTAKKAAVKEEVKAEAPKAETKAEAPKTEVKKAEAKAEAPKAEAKKAETKVEAPKTEVKKAEAKTEAPKTTKKTTAKKATKKK